MLKISNSYILSLLLILAGTLFSQPILAVNESEASDFSGYYQVHLGVAGLQKFDSKFNHYDVLYGSPSYYPTFRMEYFFFNWYALLGIGGQIGYYSDSGFAYSGEIGNGDIDPNKIDRDEKTNLTMIPMQAFGTFKINPFKTSKWISLNIYSGIERMYIQESRLKNKSDKNDKSWFIKGFNDGFLFGTSLNFRLDQFSKKSARSLKLLGISSLYFTPYLTTVKQKENFSNFGRTEYGIQFTFESK